MVVGPATRGSDALPSAGRSGKSMGQQRCGRGPALVCCDDTDGHRRHCRECDAPERADGWRGGARSPDRGGPRHSPRPAPRASAGSRASRCCLAGTSSSATPAARCPSSKYRGRKKSSGRARLVSHPSRGCCLCAWARLDRFASPHKSRSIRSTGCRPHRFGANLTHVAAILAGF